MQRKLANLVVAMALLVVITGTYLLGSAGTAEAIVHAVTPVDECAASPNAGGRAAIGKGIDSALADGASDINGPVPVTPANGVGISIGGGGDSAPVQCP